MTEREPELPWVKFPQWVFMAPISPEAKTVYGLLIAHVLGHEKGNRKAWPSQRRLANLLGYKRTETIDRSVKELEAFGLVVVERGRHPTQPLRKRNSYFVRLAADAAPDQYHGRLSVWERPEPDDDIPAGEPGTRLYPGSVEPEPPAEPSEPASARVGEPGSDRASEPASTRVELEVVDEQKVDKEKLSPALMSRADDVTDQNAAQSDDGVKVEAAPRRTLRAAAPCGFPHCRGGIWRMGMTEKTCPTCSKAA